MSSGKLHKLTCVVFNTVVHMHKQLLESIDFLEWLKRRLRKFAKARADRTPDFIPTHSEDYRSHSVERFDLPVHRLSLSVDYGRHKCARSGSASKLRRDGGPRRRCMRLHACGACFRVLRVPAGRRARSGLHRSRQARGKVDEPGHQSPLTQCVVLPLAGLPRPCSCAASSCLKRRASCVTCDHSLHRHPRRGTTGHRETLRSPVRRDALAEAR